MTAMKEKQPLSRNEMGNSHGEDSSYFLGWQEYEKNPYHSITNPSGIIQMGLAENRLSLDLLESWLVDNPDAIMLKKGNQSMLKELALFQDYHGMPAFKKAMVEFMSQIRGNKVRFDPDRLVLTAGATSANEALVFCLAECGDAFLLPAPYYPGFNRDLKWRTGVEIVPIHCSSSNGFRLTRAALEKAYNQAKKLELKVKGVLITNPSNPLSTTSTRAELDILLNFIADKRIHLISDEIYAGTVFDAPDFTSVLEALMDMEGMDNIRNRVHIVTSLSKDLGLPGFRVGAIYSENSEVISTATKMSSFGLVSSQTQFLLSELLSDKNFVSNYIAVNQKRLRQRQNRLVTGLNRIGIQCLEGNAGLFSWVDMRHLLSSSTVEGEIKLWGKMVHNVRLNISPGSSCHCTEPGWFRVCFANMSEETLDLAIQRLESFVNGSNHVVPVTWLERLSRKKWVQKLPPKDR